MAGPSPTLIYSTIALIALGGTTIGILLKIMSRITVDGERFKHPYFTSIVLFSGQALGLIPYKYEMWKLRKKYGDDIKEYPKIMEALEENLQIESSPFLFIIPALLDSIRSVLFLIAIIFVPASVSNMMGALIVVITTLLVSIFLKKKFYRQHLFGIACIITGVGGVVTAVVTNKGDGGKEVSTGQLVFGIVLIVISVMIQGVQFIVEEKLLGNIYVSAKRITGWEGIWGVCFFTVFLTIAYFVKCTGDLGTNGRLEDTPQALEQIFSSPFLLISFFCIGLFGAGLSIFGIFITKHTTSAHRATANQVKVVSIWIFFLIYKDYGTQETFLLLQLIGFIILVIGVLTFNEVIVWPIFGCNKYTKNAVYSREYRKSMKLLWNVQDNNLEQDELLVKTIRNQVDFMHGVAQSRMGKSRMTVFGAGDF